MIGLIDSIIPAFFALIKTPTVPMISIPTEKMGKKWGQACDIAILCAYREKLYSMSWTVVTAELPEVAGLNLMPFAVVMQFCPN